MTLEICSNDQTYVGFSSAIVQAIGRGVLEIALENLVYSEQL